MAKHTTPHEAPKTEQDDAKPVPADSSKPSEASVEPRVPVTPTSTYADQPWWLRANHNPNSVNV